MMFRIPTIRLLDARRDIGAADYNYMFTCKSPAMGGALGVMLGLDNPMHFRHPDVQFTGNSPEAEEMAAKLQRFLHCLRSQG
jgi:hypothetical protein